MSMDVPATKSAFPPKAEGCISFFCCPNGPKEEEGGRRGIIYTNHPIARRPTPKAPRI
jgi:hypothetical protein